VVAVVEYLRDGVTGKDEQIIASASVALTAMCTANDASKKAAAQLHGDFNEEELVKTDANDPRVPLFKDAERPGALDILLDALKLFPHSISVQTQGIGALRCLLCDDDPRQASCVPSAVENRERAISDEGFPLFRDAVEAALSLEDGEKSLPRLREHAMLLLRELATRQDRVHELVARKDLLQRVEATLKMPARKSFVLALLFCGHLLFQTI